MEKPRRRTHSLRWQMGGIILLCWIIPVAMILFTMGWYISDSLGQNASESLTEQLEVNLRMSAERIDTAVAASRMASLDSTIKDAYKEYSENPLYTKLFVETKGFLDRQFRTDGRVLFAVFYFAEDPLGMQIYTYNQGLGVRYRDMILQIDTDGAEIYELASGLDTTIGFYAKDERLYLVRNVMDSSFNTVGTLTLALYTPYFFDNISALPWAWSADMIIGEAQFGAKTPLSEAPEPPMFSFGVSRVDEHMKGEVEGDGYKLQAELDVDFEVLLGRFSGYVYLLLGMLVIAIPLLIFTFIFLRKKVSLPVEQLMGGAIEVERGVLGYQLDYEANSTEFRYLTESFNSMSGRLHYQFDRLYQEELALRDARIKALQSHINPHFLNNTLEIINWEARMNGDVKVSRMIESLATLLDATIDREKRPEVTLQEELGYVNAYLHIVDQRFGKRLTITQDIAPETLGEMVPRLIMQPVIENAVEHGIGPGGHGCVSIISRVHDREVVIEITNDGVLSEKDASRISRLLASDYDSSSGELAGNLGIANVNQRLRILYGGRSGLTIEESAGELVTARILIDRAIPQ